MNSSPLEHPFNHRIKRLLDIGLASMALMALAPFMLLIAGAVRCSSPGPILYRQERISEKGKSFFMLKFRTMSVDAERQTGPVWASSGDPRTTAIGAWLRRSSLDELPQLFNILMGDMSVVGPRPERPFFVEQFAQQIPRYQERHQVKTGLTGWAQVHGLRGNTSLEERVRYDLYYIEHWSLWLDLQIILRSVYVVWRDCISRRAY